jgi:hypothetical protein
MVSVTPASSAKQPRALLLAAGALSALFCLRFCATQRPLEEAYWQSHFNARVTIARYEHDVPLVIPRGGNRDHPVALFTPRLCNRYLADNDSVVKSSGSPFLKVVRDSGRVRVTTTWVMYRAYDTPPLVERQMHNRKAE